MQLCMYQYSMSYAQESSYHLTVPKVVSVRVAYEDQCSRLMICVAGQLFSGGSGARPDANVRRHFLYLDTPGR
jgi:hypothetical protein